LNFIRSLHTNQTMTFGDKTFSPRKGTQQVSLLSLLLFNLYLDAAIANNEIL